MFVTESEIHVDVWFSTYNFHDQYHKNSKIRQIIMENTDLNMCVIWFEYDKYF